MQVPHVFLQLLQPGSQGRQGQPAAQLVDRVGQPAVSLELQRCSGSSFPSKRQEVEAHARKQVCGVRASGGLAVLDVVEDEGEDGHFTGNGAKGEAGGVSED